MSHADTQASPAFSAALRWGFVAFCALVLLLSARMLVAAVSAHQAEQFILDWAAKGQVPSERAWHIAHAAAQRAIDWYPAKHGDYYDRLARVYEWKDIGEALGSPAASESRHRALESYRNSLSARPHAAYTWMQLGYIKLRLNKVDPEFTHALKNASYYAPWRSAANFAVAELGFAAWYELSPPERQLTIAAASKAMLHGRYPELMDIAEQLGLGETLCTRLAAVSPRYPACNGI